MAKITTEVNWKIQKATSTFSHGASRFDQHSQGDRPVGSEPKSPSNGPRETNG